MKFDFETKMNSERLQAFADLLQKLSDEIGFRVSSRGWCYILEQSGSINKDQFDKVNTWVNRCRKDGLIPIDFVAEEDSRKFKGVETPAEHSPVEDLRQWIEATKDCANRYEVDWWIGEKFYVQMVVEKIDLVTLFMPVCRRYHVPIANSKGWSSMLQRAEYARRFQEAEDQGLQCVLLYCGDHDPDGLKISDTLRKNLHDVENVYWSDGAAGYDPENLIIDRFGLNFDFIEANGFSWIDNLITGSGKNLASPGHNRNHLPYVQDYLETVGERKCEANVLVTNPEAAEALCVEAIENHLGKRARQRFAKKRQKVRDYVEEFMNECGFDQAIEEVEEAIEREDEIMEGKDWK